MVIVEDLPTPPRDSEVESWSHLANVLSALIEAIYPAEGSGSDVSDALSSFVKLAEAHAGARLFNGRNADTSLYSPLADPGIRKLLSGLLDLASFTTGRGAEFRELRELLQSFESHPRESG